MCAKFKTIPEREELLEKHIELEEENRKLWTELKQKQNQIVALNDKLLLQESLIKTRAELKKQLGEYLNIIKSLQKNLTFLQQENKILEQRFHKSQLTLQRLCSADGVNYKEFAIENAELKWQIYNLEKETRRNVLLWEKNADVASDIMFARDTIMNLEQKLIECQPLALECKQVKCQLSDTAEKLKTATFANSVLKDELNKTKTKSQDMLGENEELKKHTSKFAEVITRLKEENTSMEHFVEKSFRLEGALAELDDLNVVLKKQESMLGILFDENQSLKEGISHLFDDMNTLKDRNWKLERYANDMEESYYKAEKNANTLEHRLDYFQSILAENDRIQLNNEDIIKRNRFLEETNNNLRVKLAEVEKTLYTTTHALNVIRDENQKLVKENYALRVDMMENRRKFALENDILKSEWEKQKSLAAKYSGIVSDFKTLQRKYSESQETSFKMKEDLRKIYDENAFLKVETEGLTQKVQTLKEDRDRYQIELRNAQVAVTQAEEWIKKLEYQLNKQR